MAATGGPTDTQCLLVEAQLPVIIFQNFQHRQTILVTHTALNVCILADINSGGELRRVLVHSGLHADKPELYIVIFSLVFSRY